jgi:hypothetical protein
MLRILRSRARHGLRAASLTMYLSISPALAFVPVVDEVTPEATSVAVPGIDM